MAPVGRFRWKSPHQLMNESSTIGASNTRRHGDLIDSCTTDLPATPASDGRHFFGFAKFVSATFADHAAFRSATLADCSNFNYATLGLLQRPDLRASGSCQLVRVPLELTPPPCHG